MCPKGHWCGIGSTGPTDHPCGNGTYNPVYGGTDETACLPCPPGRVCQGLGLEDWNLNCSAGFFCIGHATHGSPSISKDKFYMGDLCPIGKYCPIATHEPFPCEPGTYR